MSYPNYDSSHYGPPPQSHPNGTTILVLGILSLVVCGFLGPFAWVMGNRALREIDESGHYFENRGTIQAGRICGIISSALMIIGVGIFVLMFGIGMIASLSSPSSY
ncbi:DUF4190 domain-containing protein [Nonomuraea sp. NPDC046802]|uniref:DUF4190 domain-containing protein n=1 Tax=Nonomuraea sp. NPDC046802 TaxID=3154919 RepID=UPI0033C5B4DF